MQFSFFDGIVIATFLISLMIFFQKPNPFWLKMFPIYFFFAAVSGFYSEWLVSHGHYNTGVANVWGTLEFCFYYYVFHEIISDKRTRRYIFILAILYGLFAFINILFIQKKIGFNAVNYSIGSLLVVLFSIYYFIELFQKTLVQSLSRSPAFWIASALLFGTVLNFPYYTMSSFMETMNKANADRYKFIISHMAAIGNIILTLSFILFSIAFLCRIRIRKSTL